MKLIFIDAKTITKGKLFTNYKKYNAKLNKKMSEMFFNEFYDFLINKFENFQKKILKSAISKIFWTVTSLYKSDHEALIDGDITNNKIYLGSFTSNIRFSIPRKTIDLYYRYISERDYFDIQFVEVEISNDIDPADILTTDELRDLEQINDLLNDVINNQNLVNSQIMETCKLTLGQIELIPEMEPYYTLLDKLLYPEESEEKYFVEINDKKIYFDDLSKFTSSDRLKLYQDLDREYNRLSM